MAQFILNPLTLSNIKRFSKFFHCQNQEKICNSIITKDPTTPQVWIFRNVFIIKLAVFYPFDAHCCHMGELIRGLTLSHVKSNLL